jgi:hypothetical protein
MCYKMNAGKNSVTVWVYEGAASIEQAQQDKVPTLVFSFELGRDAYSSGDLEYCGFCVDIREATWVWCRGGELTSLALEPDGPLTGNYSFLLDNGTTNAGRLNALLCPPGKRQQPSK